MRIYIPHALYQVFPLLCVLLGFYIVATLHTPLAIALAAMLYIYSFTVLFMRRRDEEEGEDGSSKQNDAD